MIEPNSFQLILDFEANQCFRCLVKVDRFECVGSEEKSVGVQDFMRQTDRHVYRKTDRETEKVGWGERKRDLKLHVTCELLLGLVLTILRCTNVHACVLVWGRRLLTRPKANP